jgi:hypothetical protein
LAGRVKLCVRILPTIQCARDAGKLIQHNSGGKVTEIQKPDFACLPALVAQVLQKIFDERLHVMRITKIAMPPARRNATVTKFDLHNRQAENRWHIFPH